MRKELNKSDAVLLYKYASECKFIIETGAGSSTKYLAKAALKNDSKFVSIEYDKSLCKLKKGVEYAIGWSITYNDIIKYYRMNPIDSKDFSNKNKNFIDGRIAHGKINKMNGEVDLIRKTLEKYKELELDFFFCDSGEYCGLPEWRIVKSKIKVGGYFAGHDIYYPKSIKMFKVVEEIEKNKKWKIIEKTKNKQGLVIAKKVL